MRHPKLGILHPASILIFVILVALWLLVWLLPEPEGTLIRLAARLAGYGGALAMLVPYLHILRRGFRHRDWGVNVRWLRWHLGAAYLAFFLVLVHSRGHGSTMLTLILQIILWIVMVSGVVGYYGQKLLYRLLPHLIETEYGRERLEPQRALFLQQARVLTFEVVSGGWEAMVTRLREKDSPLLALVAVGSTEKESEELQTALKALKQKTYKTAEEETEHKAAVALAFARAATHPDLWKPETGQRPEKASEELQKLLQRPTAQLTAAEVRTRNAVLFETLFPEDVIETKPVVRHFCDAAVHDCFERPFRLLPDRIDLAENRYLEAAAYATSTQRGVLESLWRLVKQRRDLNLEYRLHQAGRAWLLFHGPAAWGLLVLMIEHIVMSMWYGGF